MTQTIEQLTARVRELEEEKKELQALLDFDNARLDQIEDELEDVEYLGPYVEGIKVLKTKLAASQAYAEQLREALELLNKVSNIGCDRVEKALALPRDTSALDAYVAEKVKESRPDFRQMREMLRAMQAGELTVSRGLEILDMWWAGNWDDDMLPPVRQDLIEEDSMPVEIIDRLTRQRDLAVEALENCRLLAARHRKEEWAGHIMRFCKDAGLSGSPIRNDAMTQTIEQLKFLKEV